MFSFPIQILKTVPTIDFMKHRRIWITASIIITLATFGLLAVRGLNFGIDFVGGKLIQVSVPQASDVANIRKIVDDAGFENVTIQEYGSTKEYLIRLPGNDPKTQPATAEESILRQLKADTGEDAQIVRVEFVGPQVGQELRGKALLAVAVSFALIGLYIAFRFDAISAVGAIVSLFHDTMLTIALISITQTEVTLTVLAAILTLIGYSLNDTVVISDRIRENRARYPNRPLVEVLNLSINQTLGRTFMTVFTLTIVLLALYLFGGSVINDFAFVFLAGVGLATYSSIFVAAPFQLLLENHVKKKAAEAAEKAEKEPKAKPAK